MQDLELFISNRVDDTVSLQREMLVTLRRVEEGIIAKKAEGNFLDASLVLSAIALLKRVR